MSKKQDMEKARFWQRAIREAARSGLSTREFCRQRKLHESQFYWWQRRLAATRQAPQSREQTGGAGQLCAGQRGTGAGIELVLAGGRRLRIAKGVDEPALRSVLAALEQPEC